jgi:hypothetical protein
MPSARTRRCSTKRSAVSNRTGWSDGLQEAAVPAGSTGQRVACATRRPMVWAASVMSGHQVGERLAQRGPRPAWSRHTRAPGCAARCSPRRPRPRPRDTPTAASRTSGDRDRSAPACGRGRPCRTCTQATTAAVWGPWSAQRIASVIAAAACKQQSLCHRGTTLPPYSSRSVRSANCFGASVPPLLTNGLTRYASRRRLAGNGEKEHSQEDQ